VPDFQTTLTIRWAAPDDDSVLVTPAGAGRSGRIHRPERRPNCS
jgi:hypothetical protein